MNKISSVLEMQVAAKEWQAQGKSVALVPTNGALHAGHRSLIECARSKAAIVVVSIFANPLQFGPNEHFESYPRPIEQDLALCESAGADAVFMPSVEEMYPKGFSSFVTEEIISKHLCGVSRPTHFRGATTVVAKLINIIHPLFVVMGQKEAQLASVVRKMLTDMHFGVEVVVAPTVRDPDGLACNVRNRELTATQRQDALSIYKALQRAKEMSDGGQRSVDRINAEVTHILRQHRRIRVIYISIVDPVTMEALREVSHGNSLLAIAAWVDEIRLTDNIVI